MSDVSRHRLRWWLRAERALGLRHVHAPGLALVEPAQPAAAVSPAVPRPVPAQDRPLPQAAPPRPVPARPPVVETRPPTAPAVVPPAIWPLDEAAPTMFGAPTEPFTSAELSPDEKAAALRELDVSQVKGCTKCPLCRTRRNTVFGEGEASARLMFVGEGPGATEDETGRPFVGKAGQKLTEMIEKGMGLRRSEVYICNVVKCRAFLTEPYPKDRPPQPAEAAACMPYLERQIELVRPRVIVTLGLSASQYLLGTKESMTRMRGKWRQWRGIPVMPTFHPSYILRNYTAETRRAVWEDLKQVVAKLSAQSQ